MKTCKGDHLYRKDGTYVAYHVRLQHSNAGINRATISRFHFDSFRKYTIYRIEEEVLSFVVARTKKPTCFELDCFQNSTDSRAGTTFASQKMGPKREKNYPFFVFSIMVSMNGNKQANQQYDVMHQSRKLNDR